jgi:hypothetical protein
MKAAKYDVSKGSKPASGYSHVLLYEEGKHS